MPPRLIRPVALLLTVATGFSGLVYEVAWQKYLAILLGSHSEATAAVLGIFLAGLALGYALFGAVTRRRLASAAQRPPRLLLLYAAVEGAIGLYALAFPALFRAAQTASLAAPAGGGAAGFAFDVALTALLIGPPTVLMGATIPVLTQALARDLSDATRLHARVYACNTAGAFAGALAAGFALIPRLGLPGVLVAMGAVNLGAAAVLAALGRRSGQTPAAAGELPAAAPGRAELGGYAAVAALTGFAMMVLQTVVIRLGGLAFGASPFTFAMVVAVFVLCIALGSLLVSGLARVGRRLLLANQWLLALLVALLYGLLDQAPYWVHRLRILFGRSDADFTSFHLAAFAGLLLLLAPAVLLSGAALPLLFHHARRDARELGATAGVLYAWNTVGSLLGALLGGYALLFWLDLHAVYRVAACALVGAAAVLSVQLGERRLRVAAALAGAFGLAAIAALEPWDPRLLSGGLFRHREAFQPPAEDARAAVEAAQPGARLVFHEDDPAVTVTVNERRIGNGRRALALLTNGKPDGNTIGDYPTMALAGLIPALLAERAERAFVIGWGTGVTAGELAALPSMREVIVAEISSGVLRAAPLFDFANLQASTSLRIQPVRSDAYRALLRAPGRFDIIVSEPSNPWMTGIEMLFSREFLETARQRLAPGGVYAQWFHQYETDLETISLVLRTYAAVFDHVAVWYAGHADLLLLGLERPEAALDLARLERRARQPALRAGLERSGVRNVAELLAHELLPLGVVHALALPGPQQTLTHPRLSHQAARAFFRGRTSRLPWSGGGEPARIGRRHSLLARHLAEAPDAAERARRRADATLEACVHRAPVCTAWLAAWTRDAPDSPGLARLLATAGQRSRRFGGAVERETVLEVAELLAPAPPEDAPALPIAESNRISELYLRYYQHALPFQPERMLDAWRRCEHPLNPELCRRGLEGARRLLDGPAEAS